MPTNVQILAASDVDDAISPVVPIVAAWLVRVGVILVLAALGGIGTLAPVVDDADPPVVPIALGWLFELTNGRDGFVDIPLELDCVIGVAGSVEVVEVIIVDTVISCGEVVPPGMDGSKEDAVESRVEAS